MVFFAQLRGSFRTEQGILNALGVMEESAAKRKVVGCGVMRPRPRHGMLLMRLSRPLKTETHIKRLQTRCMDTCSNLQSNKCVYDNSDLMWWRLFLIQDSIGHKKSERDLSLLPFSGHKGGNYIKYKGQLFGVRVTVYGTSKTERGVLCGLYT